MEYFNALMKKEKQHEMVLFVVLIIYIMFDVSTPEIMAQHVDTVYGTIIVAIIALSLFLSTHPVVGILGLSFNIFVCSLPLSPAFSIWILDIISTAEISLNSLNNL